MCSQCPTYNQPGRHECSGPHCEVSILEKFTFCSDACQIKKLEMLIKESNDLARRVQEVARAPVGR